MSSNLIKPRGVGAALTMEQAPFRLGVEDFRAGRPMADDLPPLDGIHDSLANRQRLYEVGRLAAAFARIKRRPITAALLWQAKREGVFPQ